MTAAELAQYDSGPALAAYLSQPDATPDACDPSARGPHVSHLDEDVRDALVGAIADGATPPKLWLACTDALLRHAPAEEAASLLDAVGRAYKSLVKDRRFETSPTMQASAVAMQRLYVERSHAVRDDHAELAQLFDDLRAAIAGSKLGPVATRLGKELLAVTEVERGRWRGREVNAALLDSLESAKDEPTLRLFVERLPTESLRTEARRRIVRLHIAESPFPEVRAHADAVEERVLIRGSNPIDLDAHPPARGWLDPARVPVRGVLVRQNVWAQTATLLAYRDVAPNVSILPGLELRHALMLYVSGISEPVTLCGPRKELDPSPCVEPKDVTLGNPVAYLDRGGIFRFVESMPMHEAVGLTVMHDRFELPVSVGGKKLTSFVWPLHYTRPQDLVLDGAGAGMKGPRLVVGVDHRDPARYVFSVTDGARRYVAVVEARDAAEFAVASRGAQGSTGATGASGSAGASGAECQSGGNGTSGGQGGPGGPGGDGGDVEVDVDCGGAPCESSVALLRRTVASVGGPGGSGGAGGAGGPGGSGGPGRSPTTHIDSNGITVTDDPGCSAGSSGSSGSSGSRGVDGPPGEPGRVTFGVLRRRGPVY